MKFENLALVWIENKAKDSFLLIKFMIRILKIFFVSKKNPAWFFQYFFLENGEESF